MLTARSTPKCETIGRAEMRRIEQLMAREQRRAELESGSEA